MGDLRAKGRIGHNRRNAVPRLQHLVRRHVGRIQAQRLLQLGFKARERLERVCVEQLPRAVVVHDHVHLGSAHQDGVKIDAHDVLGQELAFARDQRLLLGGLAASARVDGVADFLKHVVHGRDQKPAGAHGGVKDDVVFGRVDHPHHHVAHVARREELALVAAQVGTHNRLVRVALNVHVTLEQGIHLQLRHDVGEHVVG